MRFFEMILSFDSNETKNAFYEANTEQSREHFFNSMVEKTSSDLKDYEATLQDLGGLDGSHLDVLKKRLNDLQKMKDQFIKTGEAKISSNTFMVIIKRTLLRVS